MVKVRFAPSPTGFLHVGNCRTALINWLFARKNKGIFLLRLDDTDLERSKEEYANAIHEDLQWLGLDYDEYEKQSSRYKRYQEVTQQLMAEGRLYACYETPDELEFKRKLQLSRGLPPIYDREGLSLTADQKAAFETEGRKPYWRFKLNDRPLEWNDLIRGPLHFEGKNLSDPILVREDGTPVYTLASVIDDLDMNITHVLRGEDHITNTAIQIDLLEAISHTPCTLKFGHMSWITDTEGLGFSKRIGSMGVKDLKAEGIVPMAINSMLAKLGTSDPVQPFANLDDLVDSFDIIKFAKGTPKFSFEDLETLNHKVLQHLSFEGLKKYFVPENMDEAFWLAIRGNIKKLTEIPHWWEICRGEIHPFVDKEDKDFIEKVKEMLPAVTWHDNPWDQWIRDIKMAYPDRKGPSLFMPLRKALTGQEHGPELKLLLGLMGSNLAHDRLNQALKAS